MMDDADIRPQDFDAEAIMLVGLFELHTAWDCDPDAAVFVEAYDVDLDENDDTGDWQVLVLDRFGDRTVNPEL